MNIKELEEKLDWVAGRLSLAENRIETLLETQNLDLCTSGIRHMGQALLAVSELDPSNENDEEKLYDIVLFSGKRLEAWDITFEQAKNLFIGVVRETGFNGDDLMVNIDSCLIEGVGASYRKRKQQSDNE